MKRALFITIAGLLAASCASWGPVGEYRTPAGGGTARRPGEPPARLTVGPEMSVPAPAGCGQRHPVVAYGDGTYLLVWREGFDGYRGQSDILAMRIGPDGAPLDREPIPVCATPGVQHMPSVAYCAGEFVVAWVPKPEPGDGAGRYALRTRRVGKDGKLNPRTHSMWGDRLKVWPALASNGRDEFLLVWQEYVGDHFAVRGTRISAATDRWLDEPHLNVMSRSEELGTSWAQGGRLGLAWTGSGYVASQSVYATYLDPRGRTLLPVTRTWFSYSPGGSNPAAAWGKGYLFHNVRPSPDPWGWGGNSAVVGMTVTPKGARLEREAFLKMVPEDDRNREFCLIADGCAVNCLDRSRWLNHPGWPMGMPGGLKHSHGDVWPSGPPAAAFNGRSLVVVWPRGHLADNRRVTNRDLYLARLLPGWAMVDVPPAAVATAETEENNPAMCGGPQGQTLLAYEKLTEDGVAVCYRILTEEPDRTPPGVEYVVPKSRTEMVVAFDEPLEAGSASDASHYRIDGLAVTGAVLSPDGRSDCREVILTTDPPEVGKHYTLHVDGVRDRSPAGNVARQYEFEFLAKPGLMQRCDRVYQWDNPNSSERNYPNPDLVGSRDYITYWNLLGPLALDRKQHPFDPTTVLPSPGDEVRTGSGVLTWKAAEGEAIDLSARLGKKADHMIYAATYVFSDRSRDAVLRLDSNDHNRAWWNGRLVSDGITGATGRRGFHAYTNEVPIEIDRGWNRLLMQVTNRESWWMMVGQITDAAGQPIRDLTWQLERPDGISR
ncbi:MAG: Ig-like domain-containing protein [Planctomycetota bacterium]